jgi:hypothetical protein
LFGTHEAEVHQNVYQIIVFFSHSLKFKTHIHAGISGRKVLWQP